METWMPIFVGVIALAVVVQTIMLIVIGVVLLKLGTQMKQIADDIHGRINPILSRIQSMVEESQPRITGVIADAAEMTRMAKAQAQRIDEIVAESLERLRLQVLHVDELVTGALEAVQETGNKVKQTVWAPVRSVSAVMRGIQTGFEFYRGNRRRTDGSNESVEENLFI
jgi:ElaB/YqjD/DUF883 family membrane-anchored ribosome-binding protein